MRSRRNRVLFVDDDPNVLAVVRSFLEGKGLEVDTSSTLAAALASCRSVAPDAILLDLGLPDARGEEALARLRSAAPGVPIVVLTGDASVDVAVRSIKAGAEQFLTKPADLTSLVAVLHGSMARSGDRTNAAGAARDASPVELFAGTSAAIRQLSEDARRVAGSDLPVLILGETGAGKGMLARWLHAHSPRAREPFVDLNCAGLSRDLLESEFFGYVRGAFTSANATKLGLLEAADHGTVFLDEIGEMDPAVQAKLLKALEDRRFRRLGDVRDRRVDVRLLSASNCPLIGDERFRADLYYRIGSVTLAVPPLRHRVEDIPTIARSVLERMFSAEGSSYALSPSAMDALKSYPWPGNVRQLVNVLGRAVLFASRSIITSEDLRLEHAATARDVTGADVTLAELERRHIERVLRDERGHVSAAASRLGIARSSLYEKLRRLRIDVP